MILDGFLLFTGTSNGATSTIADGPNTDAPTTGTQNSSNIVDIGVKNGIPATAVGGGGPRDLGIGDDPAMKLFVQVITAFTGGTDLTVQLAGAPDAGSNAPGSYTTMWTSPIAVTEANLIAGQQLANVDMPRIVGTQVLPRFLKLVFVSTGSHGAGDLIGAIVLDRFDQIVGTGAALSGYPAGINVAN